MAINRKGYAPKTYQKEIFAWYPDTSAKTQKQGGGDRPSIIGTIGCTALPHSQGYDATATYCYNVTISSIGLKQKSAYFACNYVK